VAWKQLLTSEFPVVSTSPDLIVHSPEPSHDADSPHRITVLILGPSSNPERLQQAIQMASMMCRAGIHPYANPQGEHGCWQLSQESDMRAKGYHYWEFEFGEWCSNVRCHVALTKFLASTYTDPSPHNGHISTPVPSTWRSLRLPAPIATKYSMRRRQVLLLQLGQRQISPTPGLPLPGNAGLRLAAD